MNLIDIVTRPPLLIPWSEGEKIPWNEPAFSARMLKEHLSQGHDAASRRFEKIDRHVHWIHKQVLAERPTHILDLACGPGFYTTRLAKLGHQCTGIDFSPASIAYAAACAADEDDAGEKLCCSYHMEDIRTAAYGEGYGLVMLIFGEFNVFTRLDACRILQKTWKALKPGGFLLLEPHTVDGVRREGLAGTSWFSSQGGLFSEKPHIVLQESFWNDEWQTATRRYFVIDIATGCVTLYGENYQAYPDKQLYSMLLESGFIHPCAYPSLTGEEDESQSHLFAIIAQKPF